MKKAIILIGILLTVVIAMVGYYFMNKKQEGFQDQSQFEEVPIEDLDENTKYIIKLTGVNGTGTITKYLSVSYNNLYWPHLVDKMDEANFYTVDYDENDKTKLRLKRFNSSMYLAWWNWEITNKIGASGFRNENNWRTIFNIDSNELTLNYDNRGNKQYPAIYKHDTYGNVLRFINTKNNFDNDKTYFTTLSFYKPKSGSIHKQRPAEGFYRIKINSLGTDNSGHAESYVGYRADNRYVITEDKFQSTVFEVKHSKDNNDTDTFTLKNKDSIYEGREDRFLGSYEGRYADLPKTDKRINFKYTIFDDLYNLHSNLMMATMKSNKDVFSRTYGDPRYKSKITFEPVDPAKEPEDGKIYKIKLTYVGNQHGSNKGVFKYIGTELINKKPQIISSADEAALFFIDKDIDNTFQMFPYNKETKSIEENINDFYKKLRRGGYEFYLEDNNKIVEYRNSLSVFSYDKYSKSLRTTENTPFRMFLINNNDNVKMHGDQQPTSINHNKTLVEFEEYTPPAPTTTTTPAPTSAASGTTAAAGTETTAAAPGTTVAAPGPETTAAAPGTETTAAAPGTTAAAPGTTAAAPGNNTPASGPGNNTPASGPETTQATVEGTTQATVEGTTQALLGAEMGVKSKVKMTPEVRDYINSELNKYTDESSLPTPEQIEQLQKIVGNNTAEELARIPNLLNKFKNNTQSYIDFHKSYEQQLEEILKTRFDAEKAANLELSERNAVRIEKLKEEVRKYADKNAVSLEVQEQENKSNPSGSLRNIGNGTMLNFDKTGDNEHVVLNMMGHKMVKQNDGSYTRDGQGDIQGCLTFDSTNRKLGTPALSACNLDNTQSPELSFKVSKISNVEEYNRLLTKINPEIKDLASEYDTINYPFQVVEPQQAPGYCVSVDDNKVRILPCEKDSNQRYRKMHYQVKNQCGQNNNGNQS